VLSFPLLVSEAYPDQAVVRQVVDECAVQKLLCGRVRYSHQMTVAFLAFQFGRVEFLSKCKIVHIIFILLKCLRSRKEMTVCVIDLLGKVGHLLTLKKKLTILRGKNVLCLNLASTTKTAQSWSDCGEIIKIC
jgi:hypothetical protein